MHLTNAIIINDEFYSIPTAVDAINTIIVDNKEKTSAIETLDAIASACYNIAVTINKVKEPENYALARKGFHIAADMRREEIQRAYWREETEFLKELGSQDLRTLSREKEEDSNIGWGVK